MRLESLMAEVTRELSGVRAKENVGRVASYHRIQGSRGYGQAVEMLQKSLDGMGIANQVAYYPADGVSRSCSWTPAPAWNVRAGSLRQSAPQERLLSRFDEIPQGVVSHSRGGTAEGELIDVGDGTSAEDYEGKDVAGKFVMATGRTRQVAALAVARGAIAVVVYPSTERARDYPDLVQYEGFWPDANTIDATPLGFSISRRQADVLLSELSTGKVFMSGEVDADFSAGSLEILDAVVPGSNPSLGDVVLVAHLCHPRPSANDNASGSGLLMEIARTLAALVRSDRIKLQRPVRFLWVPELYGTLPWAQDHDAEVRRMLFVLSLDMVGEAQQTLGTPFHVGRVPASIPSYLNAWFEPVLAKVANAQETIAPLGSRLPMNWVFARPSGGSDHLVFSDAMYRIPAAILGHEDPLHHTHLDDMDMVDTTELKRVGVLATTIALLPNMLEDEVSRLSGWLVRYGTNELCQAFELCIAEGMAACSEILDTALRIEQERVESFKLLADSIGIRLKERECQQALRTTCKQLQSQCRPSSDTRGSRLNGPRPRRLIDGPIPNNFFRSLPRAGSRRFVEQHFSGHHGALPQELLNLSNGERGTREIAQRLSLDFNRKLSEATVVQVLEILEKGGWIAL
jgi:hypothetical protein